VVMTKALLLLTLAVLLLGAMPQPTQAFKGYGCSWNNTCNWYAVIGERYYYKWCNFDIFHKPYRLTRGFLTKRQLLRKYPNKIYYGGFPGCYVDPPASPTFEVTIGPVAP